jgi:hypothetical protein
VSLEQVLWVAYSRLRVYVDEEREGGRRLALRLLKPAERLCVCCNWPNKSGPPSSLHPSQPAVGVANNLALSHLHYLSQNFSGDDRVSETEEDGVCAELFGWYIAVRMVLPYFCNLAAREQKRGTNRPSRASSTFCYSKVPYSINTIYPRKKKAKVCLTSISFHRKGLDFIVAYKLLNPTSYTCHP